MMVSRNSAYLGIAQEVRVVHKADHFKLVKFAHVEDTRYQMIVGHIQKFVDQIRGIRGMCVDLSF